jgi:hypothetical protein
MSVHRGGRPHDDVGRGGADVVGEAAKVEHEQREAPRPHPGAARPRGTETCPAPVVGSSHNTRPAPSSERPRVLNPRDASPSAWRRAQPARPRLDPRLSFSRSSAGPGRGTSSCTIVSRTSTSPTSVPAPPSHRPRGRRSRARPPRRTPARRRQIDQFGDRPGATRIGGLEFRPRSSSMSSPYHSPPRNAAAGNRTPPARTRPFALHEAHEPLTFPFVRRRRGDERLRRTADNRPATSSTAPAPPRRVVSGR